MSPLPESNVKVHSLVHSKLCESGLRRLFSLRVINKRVQHFSKLCRVLILSSRYRDSSHCHTPNVHVRAFALWLLCLWRHVQFGCSLGRCSRPEPSFRSRRRHHSRRKHYKNIPLHRCLLLTYGSGLSLSSNIRVLRTSTRSDDDDQLLLDLSSVGFSWTGGKAGAGVRCFLRLPRRGAFGTRSHGTLCSSNNNEVSERFVGSSLRIVLAPIAPLFVPTMCSGFVSD